MNLIAAVDSLWNIGFRGNLLERIPADLKQFSEKTRGRVVVMGRKTLEALPGQKPLPDRINVVLTRSSYLSVEGIVLCRSMGALQSILSAFKPQDIFLIGGGEVYHALLQCCDHAYITKIHQTYEADTSIVNLDMEDGWELVSEEGPFYFRDDIMYSYCNYKNHSVVPLSEYTFIP